MAAFFHAAAARPRSAWSPEEAAVFSARRDFELLRLLSTDKKAFAMARRLGFMTSCAGASPKHGAAARAAGAASVAQQAPADAVGDNSRRRRSARRSALRHERRRRLLCRSCALCLFFVLYGCVAPSQHVESLRLLLGRSVRPRGPRASHHPVTQASRTAAIRRCAVGLCTPQVLRGAANRPVVEIAVLASC